MDLQQSQTIVSLKASCVVGYKIYFLGGKPYSFMDSNFLYQYDTINKTSAQLLIKNEIPLYTFKPTMNYNPNSHSLILFGGEAEFQYLTSTIFQISLYNFTCTEITPTKSSEIPRQRYGQCAEFRYPYLIVFGGKSLLGPQNDIWAFNVQTLQWIELKRSTKEEIKPRYLLGSTLAEDVLYVYGGLNGEEECYSSPFQSCCILKDLLKIDLKGFFESGQTSQLQWQQIATQILDIYRDFGWNIEYTNGKFIFFPSIIDVIRNPDNQIFYFDPEEKQARFCIDYLPMHPEDDFYFQCRIDNCFFLTSLTHQRGSSYCINILFPESFDYISIQRQDIAPSTHRQCFLQKCFNLTRYKRCREYQCDQVEDMLKQYPEKMQQLENWCQHLWVSLEKNPFIRYSNFIESTIEQPTITIRFNVGRIMKASLSFLEQKSKYINNLLIYAKQPFQEIEANCLFKNMSLNCIRILTIYIQTGRLILPVCLTATQCQYLILLGQYFVIDNLTEVCTCKLLSMVTKQNYLSLISFCQKNQLRELEQHLWNATVKYFMSEEGQKQVLKYEKIANDCLSQMYEKNKFFFIQKEIQSKSRRHPKSRK